MCKCICTANFDNSSLVQKNISDLKFKTKLNSTLNEMIIEYGGLKYRLKRAEYIRKECEKKDVDGLLHCLWPNVLYVSTALGSSHVMYKEIIQQYSGDKLRLINLAFYISTECPFGISASISPDEYFFISNTCFL